MKKTSVLFVLVFILINIRTVYSQEDIKSPFLLKEINISTSGIDKTGNISLRTEIVEDGEVSFEFHGAEVLRNSEITYDKILGKYSSSNLVKIDLPLKSIEDGFHFIEIGMGFKADNQKNTKVASYQTFPLYFQVKDSKVIEQGDKPNELFNEPPFTVDENEPKPLATFVPIIDSSKSFIKTEKIADTYTIQVYIYGQVRYQQSSLAYSFSTVNKGMPATTVRLDWDFDNNPSTGYTPYYGGNTEHIDFARSDMNGNFYLKYKHIITEQIFKRVINF